MVVGRVEILPEIHRSHGTDPVDSGFCGMFRKIHGIVRGEAPHVRDQFCATVRRLHSPLEHALALILRKQKTLAGGTSKIKTFETP